MPARRRSAGARPAARAGARAAEGSTAPVIGNLLIPVHRVARRAKHFPESVIRVMTRLCLQHGSMNLAQGFPDFECPPELKEAAKRAIDEDYNQYAITWGAKSLRDAIAAKARTFNRIPCEAEENGTVACASTGAMMAALLSVVNPGEEVVIFEPYYENYGPDAILSGAKPRYVRLEPPGFGFDEEQLKRAFRKGRTKAVVINTPNNPSGKVFTRDELGTIADLVTDYDAIAVTDEIYEHILYDGRRHVSIASLDGMADRTVTISGMSKTYSVTGWRVAWAIAPPTVSVAIRRIHDFLTVGAPHPFQEAGAVALRLPESYYRGLLEMYTRKRDLMCKVLDEAGFSYWRPEGAYYIMSDISSFGFKDDLHFAEWLVREGGVGVVPGSSFFADPGAGRRIVRFTYSKQDATIEEAGRRLRKLAARPRGR